MAYWSKSRAFPVIISCIKSGLYWCLVFGPCISSTMKSLLFVWNRPTQPYGKFWSHFYFGERIFSYCETGKLPWAWACESSFETVCSLCVFPFPILLFFGPLLNIIQSLMNLLTIPFECAISSELVFYHLSFFNWSCFRLLIWQASHLLLQVDTRRRHFYSVS